MNFRPILTDKADKAERLDEAALEEFGGEEELK